MKGVIYKVTNRINGKIYVGQTIRTLELRWYSHVYDATISNKDTKLARAIRKYGPDAFEISVLEETEDLNEREKYYIKTLASDVNGYNIKPGGQGGKHAEETKNKISTANSKRVWTEEMRKNMSEAIKQWHKERGYVPRSEEFKRKITEHNQGRKMPAKAREAFSNHNARQSKPIICIESGKEYPSVLAACRDLNLNDGHLRMHLKGRHSHVKGLHFKFK